jgi:hypothetical protein
MAICQFDDHDLLNSGLRVTCTEPAFYMPPGPVRCRTHADVGCVKRNQTVTQCQQCGGLCGGPCTSLADVITAYPNGRLVVQVKSRSRITQERHYYHRARKLAADYPNNRSIIFVRSACNKYYLREAIEEGPHYDLGPRECEVSLCGFPGNIPYHTSIVDL